VYYAVLHLCDHWTGVRVLPLLLIHTLPSTVMRSLTLSDTEWLEYKQALSFLLSASPNNSVQRLHDAIDDLLLDATDDIWVGE
jgi:hypothetical protein